jgi:flagellar basal body-associated protein FliL
MIKLIVYLVVFTVGAGLGIWWGVNHPSEAALVSSQEEIQADKIRSVAQAKIQLLEQFVSTKPADPNSPDYNKMLDQEKQKLQGTPPPTATN